MTIKAPRLFMCEGCRKLAVTNPSVLLQELVNRWSEQIFGAHRDERETADLRERHAQMQEARSARKRAEQMAATAAEDNAKPVGPCSRMQCWQTGLAAVCWHTPQCETFDSGLLSGVDTSEPTI